MTILKSESIDMKWTVLSDNRSCDDSLETEHGLSVLLETDHHRILMDTGASDVFIRNAEKMGREDGYRPQYGGLCVYLPRT